MRCGARARRGCWSHARAVTPAPSWQRPALVLPSLVLVTAPVPPPPPPPRAPAEAEPVPPPASRFERLAINRARPKVIVAASAHELAFSRDDGATVLVATLPPPALRDGEAPLPEVPPIVVTPSGSALVARHGEPWLRTPDGVHLDAEPAPFPERVRLIAADRERIVADVIDDLEIERFLISTDDGKTWVQGPQPPREAYAIDMRPGGAVQLAYAWSVSCGGGDEGFATWKPGDTEWSYDSRGPIAFLGADQWLYGASTWCADFLSCAGEVSTLRAWGPKDRVAVGPTLPAGVTPWFATDGVRTYAGMGAHVLSVRAGVFSPVEDQAPPSLRDVVVDGRGRLVGLTTQGIARRAGEGGFEELSVPRPVSARPPAPAPPR